MRNKSPEMLIDWQLCVVLLHKRMTYWKIGAAASINYKHLLDLAAGTTREPRFNSGVRLLDLAYDVLPEEEFKRIRARA